MLDRDVRAAVRRWLSEAHAGESDTVIVEEMGIWAGTVRIDVAVINGELHGFELKSARDTLDRLPRQAEFYSEAFDRVTLVAAGRHAEKARKLIPEWWGLVTVAEIAGGCPSALETARAALPNPGVSPIQIARLLWRAETITILDRHGLLGGFRSKPSEVLATRLAAGLEIDTLRSEVRAALKARQGWLGQLIGNQRQMPV